MEPARAARKSLSPAPARAHGGQGSPCQEKSEASLEATPPPGAKKIMTHCHVISGAAKTKALRLRRCLATATYKDKASSLLLLLLPVGKMSPSPGPAGLRWPHSSVGPMWDAFGCSPSAEPLQPALGCHHPVPGLRPAPSSLGSWCAGTPRPLLQLPSSATHQLRADLMDFHLLTSPSGLFLMSFLVFQKKKTFISQRSSSRDGCAYKDAPAPSYHGHPGVQRHPAPHQLCLVLGTKP